MQVGRGPFASVDIMGFKTPLNVCNQLLLHGQLPMAADGPNPFNNNCLRDRNNTKFL